MLCASVAAAYGESDANGNQTQFSASTSTPNANSTSTSSLDVAKLLTDLTFEANRELSLGTASDTDDDESRTDDDDDDDDDDARSSSAESTSCSENSFEMSSAASFASTLNKSDSLKSPVPVISSPEIDTAMDSEAPSSFVIEAVHQLSVAVQQSVMHGGETTSSSGSSGISDLSEASDSLMSLDRSTRPKSLMTVAPRGRGPTTSTSMDSFLFQKPLSPRAREQISQELSQLDTGLPTLDFESLEKKLSIAAREHEAAERRKLGDEVRRRLALQYDQSAGPSPPVNHHPARSNLGARYYASKKLQVCYHNELADEDDVGVNRRESDIDSDDDDDDENLLKSGRTSIVPKSKSTPNLCRRRGMNATELARRTQPDAVGFQDRLTILREETQIMFRKAKEAAKLQMEVDRQTNPAIEKVTQKKWTRLQLTKMKTKELADILHGLKLKIDGSNAELVQLLVEKDGLWMEQDSILVDIEDAIQHRMSSESLNLPSFLYVADPQPKQPPSSAPTTSRNMGQPTTSSISAQFAATSSIFAPSRWKLFKR